MVWLSGFGDGNGYRGFIGIRIVGVTSSGFTCHFLDVLGRGDLVALEEGRPSNRKGRELT